MTIRQTITFDTSFHSVETIELERVNHDDSKWLKLVMIDVDGWRNVINVFGTEGRFTDDGLRAAENVCDELRRQSEIADENHSELESKLDRCRQALATEQEGNRTLNDQLADAQGEARDREATIENLEQEAHAFRETIDQLRSELRVVNAAYESAQERGLI